MTKKTVTITLRHLSVRGLAVLGTALGFSISLFRLSEVYAISSTLLLSLSPAKWLEFLSPTLSTMIVFVAFGLAFNVLSRLSGGIKLKYDREVEDEVAPVAQPKVSSPNKTRLSEASNIGFSMDALEGNRGDRRGNK